MKNFSKLIVVVACICTSSVAFAKNKENCHGIGGKWLPGSTTNAEVGACIFTMRASTSKKNVAPQTAADEKTITLSECTKRGGKVTTDGSQCVTEFGATNGTSPAIPGSQNGPMDPTAGDKIPAKVAPMGHQPDVKR